MKKQKIEKRPTRARRAVKSVVIMFCALLICNMLSGGHLTRAMALRDGEQRYGVYEKTHEITSLPAENIYKTLRVTLMASENVTYCGASHFYTLLGWQDDFGVPLDCSDLYGGFVGQHESLEEAANRVILDLTGMKNLYIRQVGTFGNIDRDPGERVISVAYCTLINVVDYDDKLREQHGLEWVSLKDLPQLYADHNQMIQDAISQIRRRINTEPLSFKLLPNLFTLTQLQHVFEAVMDEEIDKRNFRKRIKDIDFIEKTELIDKTGSRRGAALYRFNKKAYAQNPSFKLK